MFIRRVQGKVGKPGVERYIGKYIQPTEHPPILHCKATWGEPANICDLVVEKRCPACNISSKGEEGMKIDIGWDSGKFFGARCEKCGWSCGFDMPWKPKSHKKLQKTKEIRKNAHRRGYNRKWQKARLSYLKQHPLCENCLKEGVTRAAAIVHHKIPHRGDKKLFWDRNNWQALCKECHKD